MASVQRGSAQRQLIKAWTQWMKYRNILVSSHSIASSLMLMLDHTTLFYFSLRDLDDKNKHPSLIKDWATKIPCNAKPGGTHSKATPSLTQ